MRFSRTELCESAFVMEIVSVVSFAVSFSFGVVLFTTLALGCYLRQMRGKAKHIRRTGTPPSIYSITMATKEKLDINDNVAYGTSFSAGN